MNDLNVLSLCDGISCGRVALEKIGIKVGKYYACEIKPHAIKVSQSNFPDIIQLGDLTKVDIGFWESLKGKIDLFLCGSPCQDLSVANSQRKGLKGEKSSLFYKCVEIMELVNPKYFLFENVVMTGENLNIFTNTLKVMPLRINSSLASAQSRTRLYWTNIGELAYDLTGFAYSKIQQPKNEGLVIEDILDYNESKYITNPRSLYNFNKNLHKTGGNRISSIRNEKQRKQERGSVLSVKQKSSCLLATDYKCPKIVYINNSIRFLNPLEYERLQTLPDDYTVGVSNASRYNLIGDAWTVDVIAHILKGLK